MNPVLRSLAVALSLVAVIVSSREPAAASTPNNGRILLARSIYPYYPYVLFRTVAADGTDPVEMPDMPTGFGDPDFSADGMKIAYIARAGSPDYGYDLFTMDADGTNRTKVVDLGYEWVKQGPYDLDWSPDGTRFLFSANGGHGTWALYTVAFDGTDLVKLTDRGINFDPSWSPDGSRIAFVNTSKKGHRIFTIAADGTDRKLVDDTNHFEPLWSPDGQWIVLEGPRGTLFTIEPDGTNLTKIPGTRYMRYAQFSPDGTRILATKVLYLKKERSSTWTLSIDGSNPIKIANRQYGLAWQPIP